MLKIIPPKAINPLFSSWSNEKMPYMAKGAPTNAIPTYAIDIILCHRTIIPQIRAPCKGNSRMNRNGYHIRVPNILKNILEIVTWR
mmetsp:Transcript_52/g.111  ORF Transcript_52/g.111 Transcript_52/m.111 type:complete len:86 (+) Transcript_52:424-681(+)